ncbi:MAG: YifB family Mg chelatase-like AAA ATPase [Acutalibacteraceae bacterium]|nr:YifB family Mg chelatase-like AAA ATPase [Acutalibacteraceae bacterium]
MFSKVSSVGLFGLATYMVEVEADVSGGMPRFDVVGLPDTAVSESRERVRSAMKNAGLKFPVGRITVNLAPADKRKEGPLYDLPIFVALLKASGQFPFRVDGKAFIGELSLNGNIRRVNGALPMVIEARQRGIEEIFVPALNAAESCVVEGIKVYPVNNVFELLAHFRGTDPIAPARKENYTEQYLEPDAPDFSDVMGQYEAKFALEVAAAGGHNVMMIGPPGSGKSMLAKRIPSILPDMSFEESIETTKVHSVAGALPSGVSLIRSRPFRSPHHTVSPAGFSGGGGGSMPRPGEMSLAHNGVLFLDELPEFAKTTLESMRQPMEDGVINITRVAGTVSYACSFMLVCAMNPCPCGFYGHPTKECTCSHGSASRYLNRVSGPLLDRLDIHIEVPPVDYDDLSAKTKSESSAEIKKRVDAARQIQRERFKGTSTTCNAKMTPAQTREFCVVTDKANELLKNAFDRLGLSARAYDKILRVARTVADLDGSEQIDVKHISRAIQFRSLDRKFWGR